MDAGAPRMLRLPEWTRTRYEWEEAEGHLRSFLALTHRWVDPAFERLWDDIGKRPGSWDGPDQADTFFEETKGLWPQLYNWLLHGMLVCDAMAAFEVYLEKVSAEVLRSGQMGWSDEDGRSPEWNLLVRFARQCISVKVNTNRILAIRKMRNIFTHQRGELRTARLQQRFGANDSVLPDNVIRLTRGDVDSVIDDLAIMVERVDSAAYRYTHGGLVVDVEAFAKDLQKHKTGTEMLIPAAVIEQLTDALARWRSRSPAEADGGLHAGQEMAAAVEALLKGHTTQM